MQNRPEFPEGVVISRSIEKCDFCGGDVWICWDLISNKKPISFHGGESVYVDMDMEWDYKRMSHFVDECFNCGVVVS